MKINSVIFFIANKKEKVVVKYAGLIRTYLGNICNLIDKNKFSFFTINDFQCSNIMKK